MKYTARGESRVANIARGEAECYTDLSRDSHQLRAVAIYKRSSCSVLSVLLYFTLTKVSANTVLWSF